MHLPGIHTQDMVGAHVTRPLYKEIRRDASDEKIPDSNGQCGEPHRVYHIGDPTPYELEGVFQRMAEAGGRRVRVLRVPPAMVGLLATVATPLRRLGLLRTALTRDKAREALQNYWTSRTVDSLEALAVGDQIPLEEGARTTWAWYSEKGWLS